MPLLNNYKSINKKPYFFTAKEIETMGAPRKIEPQFELPPKLLEAIQSYLGPSRMGRLTVEQKTAIVGITNDAAAKLDSILELSSQD